MGFSQPHEAKAQTTIGQWIAFFAASGLTLFLVPHVWQRGFAPWLALHVVSRNWGAQGFLAVFVVSVLMAWAGPAIGARWGGRRVVGVGVLVWLAVSTWTWHTRTSVLSPDRWLFVCTVASGLWLLWMWGMFLVPWSWTRRLGVMVVLVAIVPMLTLAVGSQGLDGQGAVALHWKSERSRRTKPVDIRPGESALPGEQDLSISNDDYPMFRGLDRRAIIGRRAFDTNWTSRAPRELWRRPVGAGWGAFAISGSQAVTQEQRGQLECIVCYDLLTGRELWIHERATHFPSSAQEASNMGGEGPRATPTMDEECVYALGATGWLSCVDRRDGSERWAVDTLQDNDAPILVHGMACSPLLVDNVVVVSAGGGAGRALVAYDRPTGQRVWRAGDDTVSYASPQLFEITGVRQIVIHNAPGVSAHAVDDGRVLWSHAWENDQAVSCSQPVLIAGSDRRLLLSSGYGKGCALIEVVPPSDEAESWSVEEIWTSRSLKTKFSSAVVQGGLAFGFDDAILCCVDLADGKLRWKRGRYGHGQLMLVEDTLLVQGEGGEVVLLAIDGEKQREWSQLAALDGKTWNNPALAGRLLIVRNDHEAVCYELPTR